MAMEAEVEVVLRSSSSTVEVRFWTRAVDRREGVGSRWNWGNAQGVVPGEMQ